MNLNYDTIQTSIENYVSHIIGPLLRQKSQASSVPGLRGIVPRKIRSIVITQAESHACITRNATFSKSNYVHKNEYTKRLDSCAISEENWFRVKYEHSFLTQEMFNI